MNTARFIRHALAIAVIPVLAACGGDDDADTETQAVPGAEVSTEALRVTDAELGRAIGADSRITDAGDTDDFAATDTIYVSVATEGTGTGSTLTARWTFEDGQVVDETSRTISPTGPTVTEFHISMDGGMPAGTYTVEILLNGQSVEREDFEVRGS